MLPNASFLTEFHHTLVKSLPQNVCFHLIPLEVSDTFRDGLLMQNVALTDVAKGAVLKRQCEYLAGRYCAIKSLTQLEQKQGILIPDKQVGTGENREPVWPTGVLGAISHSNQYAMAMVSQTGRDSLGLGIDIEEQMTVNLARDLCRQILSEQEELLFKTLDGYPFEAFVTLVFSAKESIFKALYPSVGEYFGFEVCELVTVDVIQQRLTFRLTCTLTQRWQIDKTLEVRYLSLPARPDKEPSKSSWITFTLLS